MSACIVLTPVLITAWPMLAAAVTTAAASAGFRVVREEKKSFFKKTTTTEISMENLDVVADTLSHDNKIVVEKDGVTVSFSRDARGHFKTCVEGHLAKEELRRIGEELAGKVVQNYVYRRLQTELQNQGFMTLDEERNADDSIQLHVRRMQ